MILLSKSLSSYTLELIEVGLPFDGFCWADAYPCWPVPTGAQMTGGEVNGKGSDVTWFYGRTIEGW